MLWFYDSLYITLACFTVSGRNFSCVSDEAAELIRVKTSDLPYVKSYFIIKKIR